jgi:hypothetical protein
MSAHGPGPSLLNPKLFKLTNNGCGAQANRRRLEFTCSGSRMRTFGMGPSLLRGTLGKEKKKKKKRNKATQVGLVAEAAEGKKSAERTCQAAPH